MDAWKIIRDFRNLSASGKVDPIKCMRCREPFITRLGSDDEPVFVCYVCDIKMKPGVEFLKLLEETNERHRVEDE